MVFEQSLSAEAVTTDPATAMVPILALAHEESK